MTKRFYLGLALTNLRKNTKLYTPYVLTSIGMIMMFYIVLFLYKNKGLAGSGSVESLREMVLLGSIVTGIFSTVFLFYTNSFLIKRRKKEFGLYSILGFEKKHIGAVMLMEALLVAGVCLVAGLAMGILMSKIMFLLLLKILRFQVSFGFEVSVFSLVVTGILFAGIFALTLVFNLCQIHLAQPLELLKAGQTGEREPRTKWLLAIIGAVCLGVGYAISLTTEKPVEALHLFFVAVLLVIAGTYCLFTAGSIALLKALRRNKKYYYRTKHFTGISGMIYRMKQNAAGLASICILSTAVLVMLSTTISMYAGLEDILRTRYPRNIMVEAHGITENQAAEIDSLISGEMTAREIVPAEMTRYRYRYFVVERDGEHSFRGMDEPGYSRDRSVLWTDKAAITCMTVSDYNRLQKQMAELGPDDALLYSNGADYNSGMIAFAGKTLRIKQQINELAVEKRLSSGAMNSYYLVVSDQAAIDEIARALGEEPAVEDELSFFCGFDTTSDGAAETELAMAIAQNIQGITETAEIDSAEISRESLLTTYGGLFFLGIFLGSLFVMATVLIIYYKQVSEGYDDRERFEIMQKVGMSRNEVKRAIRSQVLTVFFLPLVAAVIHIAFGFKVIVKLLVLLHLTNTVLFVFCTCITILVFALLYAFVYALTARVYYKIVS